MRQRSWLTAQKSLEEIIEKLPRDGEAHLLLAEVYGELDSVQNMLATLEKARDISTKYIKRANFITEKYWFKNFNLGLKHFEQKQFDEAVKRFALAVKIDSGKTSSNQRYADALFMASRYEESKRMYLSVLAKQPDDLVFKDNLAEIYFIQEDYDKSVQLCNGILAEKPFDINALKRRAYAFEAMGNFEEAEMDFRVLADMNPTPKLLTDFGMLYFQHGDYERAIKRFTEALNISSDRTSLYRYLGEANWRLLNYKAMVKWYQRLVEDQPNDLLGWKNLALAYEALGQKGLLSVARNHIRQITTAN
ncbi:tetratricopeptide repeat protein [candidate division KSB1 bacterium]|nr:tetratricopeptide repeat protein [candidate division KSB1 bacterium]NIR73433.1 tetratricopeptide repeat protein [candidate division KSB1 bacterium]NIS28424.1 tetratricopeptide repeat protein [candidate division KSB1 bacterium]NIT75304.1 tetratricopeptide repeat protein [candidate division KSB1 bacterium]NIU29152.1 tetratricopeptide repeat protein [candidate division KSB1 bacterium]